MQVFVDGSIVWAQQDSTKLSLAELKQTVGLLTELQGRRELDATFLDKEAVYKNIIEGYQNDEELYKQQIENLKLNIEAVKPKWYNNFWVGATASAIVSTAIYLLVR